MTHLPLARWQRGLFAVAIMGALALGIPAARGGKPGGNPPPPPPPPPAPFSYVLEILPNPGEDMYPIRMNDLGDLTGDLATAGSGTFLYLRDEGVFLWEDDFKDMIDPTADWGRLYVWAVNSFRDVAVTGYIGEELPQNRHTFLVTLPADPEDEPAVHEVPSTAPGMEPIFRVMDINEFGDMCGYSTRPDGNRAGWIYDALLDQTTHIGETEYQEVRPYALNDLLQVTGSIGPSGSSAFRYSSGGGWELFESGDSSSYEFGRGINNSGVIAGRGSIEGVIGFVERGKHKGDPIFGLANRAFVWDPGGQGAMSLGGLSELGDSEADAINDSGVVVGESEDRNSPMYLDDNVFVYLDGTMYKLQDLVLNLPSGVRYLTGSNRSNETWTQLNENGDIAGTIVYSESGRPSDIFIATPVPTGP